MEHERLANVPHICEVCFAPVGSSYRVSIAWPGAFGLSVYIHSTDACWQAAEKRIAADRKRRRT